MKYFASFFANNGTTFCDEVAFTSKRKAIAWARGAMAGEHFCQPCNDSNWDVYDETGKLVACGGMYGYGRYYRR